MKAVYVNKTGCELVDRPVPTPEAGELLIKVEVAASNPADWKLPVLWGSEGVQGCDAAGFVEAAGPGVTEFVKGDRVAVFTNVGEGDRAGAYAEYTIAKVNTTIRLGPATSFEDGAAVPVAVLTAALAVYRNLDLHVPAGEEATYKVPDQDGKTPSILIYGAATTVGVMAVQLAKRLGLFVVGVAGASAELAKSYGCDLVLNYKSPGFEANLVEAVKAHSIHRAVDAVSHGNTTQLTADALAAAGGEGYLTTLLHPEHPEGLPTLVNILVTATPTVQKAGADGAQEFAGRLCKLLGGWLERGELRPQKVTVIPGGLMGVAVGLKRYQEDRVSGEKLVYRISETPGLA